MSTPQYHCVQCDYTTAHRGNFNKHLKTNKHDTNKNYQCHCGKGYIHRQSYHRHIKECKPVETSVPPAQVLVERLIEANAELAKAIREMLPRIGHRVNINIFLQEKCKDAINLSDFVNSLEISVEDLQNSPTQGLVTSISNTLVNALSSLDLYERPIHCSDKKRATIYFKDNDRWDRDVEQAKMREVIDTVSYKQFLKFKELMYTFDETNTVDLATHLSQDLEKTNSYKKIIANLSQQVYVNDQI
jgi:hypothetical protein